MNVTVCVCIWNWEREGFSVNIDSKAAQLSVSKLRLLLVNTELCGKLHPTGTSRTPKQTANSVQRAADCSAAGLLKPCDLTVTFQPEDWIPQGAHLCPDWSGRRLNSGVMDCSSCCWCFGAENHKNMQMMSVTAYYMFPCVCVSTCILSVWVFDKEMKLQNFWLTK